MVVAFRNGGSWLRTSRCVLHASREETDASDDRDLDVRQMLRQCPLQALEVVGGIGEDPMSVVSSHDRPGHEVSRHASVQQRRAEEHCTRVGQRLQVLEHHRLLADGAGQAMKDVVEPDRIEGGGIDRHGFEHVRLMDLGPVPRDPLRGDLQARGAEVHQREAGRRGRVAAAVEEVASADTHVEVVTRDPPVVVAENAVGRTSPRHP